MKRRAFLASGAAAAALAPQTARAQFRGAFQQRLTIGINAPLSGPQQAAGTQLVTGVQIAIDFANQFTPMLNAAFALRMFDTAGEYAQLVNNVQFAAGDPSVMALITAFDGGQIDRALFAYANAQMPLIVPATTADAITSRGYRFILRLPTTDSVEGQLFARYLGRHARPKFAIAVSQDGVYGGDVMNGFTNQSRASKFQSDGYVFPSDKPDYQAAAKTILTKSPDYVLLCGQTSTLGPLIPALRTAGYKGKMGACEGFYNGDLIKAYATEFGDGLVSTSFPPLDRIPDANQQFMDFRSHANITIDSAFAYAAAQVVMSAVRRIGATNRLAAMTALQTPSSYSTLVGEFQFAPTGDPIDPNIYFYTIDGDTFKYFGPSHASAFVL